jgi:glycosyltransferase involved in cell wall biosynthesis
MISIVIPVFNSASTLSKTIGSVKSQSFKDFEAIIVNDGSTDNSLETINQEIKDDLRFVIINQTNSGVSAARNCGILKAKYDFVAFLDADDEWENDYLEKINFQISKFPSCIGYGTLYKRCLKYGNEKLKITNTSEKNSCFIISSVADQLIKGGLPFFTSSIVVRKKILLGAGMFHEKINCGEDLLMWIKISFQGDIAVFSKMCVNYKITINQNGKLRRKNDLINDFCNELSKLNGSLSQVQINQLSSDSHYSRYLNSLVTVNRITNIKSILNEFVKMILFNPYKVKRYILIILFFFPSFLIDKIFLYKK